MRVRRFGFLFVIAVVVALVLSLATAFAEAQYYGPSPVQSLIQGNLNLVHGSRYGGGGYYYPSMYQQPMFQQSSRPMTTFEGGILGGVIGALGARTATRNTRVITGVAAGTAVVGALWARHNSQKVQQQQYQPSQGHGQLVPDSAPMPETPTTPEPIAEPEPQEQEQGEWVLSNPTGFPLDVFDGQEFLGRMKTGEIWSVDAPRVGYRAEALIPNNHGGISRGKTDIRATDTGWEFVPPAVVAGR